MRIPHWVATRHLVVGVNGQPVACDWTGRYLNVAGLAPGDSVVLTFPIAESAGSYTVAAHTPWERTYTCTFPGSTLVDISPRDESPTSYPLYRPDHMRADAAPMREVTRFVPDRIITRW